MKQIIVVFFALVFIGSFVASIEARQASKVIKPTNEATNKFNEVHKKRSKVTPSQKKEAVKRSRRQGLLPGVAGQKLKKVKESNGGW